MDHSVGCRIVLCLFLVTVKDASGQMKPSNDVAEIGGEAIFNCSDPLLAPNWFMSKDGTSTNQLLIATGCNVNPALQNHYKTEPTGGPPTFICNLIVFNVTMEHAGVFWCTGSGVPANALLTIVDSSPGITYNNTPDVIESENVVITCTLNYNGSVEPAPTLQPYFYWTDYTGRNVSSFYDSTPVNSPVISQIAVTAGRQDIMPYTCHVYLKLIPTTTPMYASNTPSANSSDSSQRITVHYGPSKPSSTSRPEIISINAFPCGISVLTCSSTANPAPGYKWYDSADNVILSTTSTLTLAEVNRNYKCEAYNTIRNALNTSSTTYTVSKDNCSTSTVDCCVCPRNETTSVTGEGCDDGKLCDCSQGSSVIILICNAKTFPNASYMWTGSDGQVTNGQVFNKVTNNGTHRCTAYFDRASSNYTGDVSFPNGTNETTVDTCCETWELIISVLIPYFGWNVIAMVVFFVFYSRNSGFGCIMDQRFPEHTTVIVCLLVIASVFFGLFIIPIVVTIACCSSLKKGELASNKTGSYPMAANTKDRHQRNGEHNPEVNNPENARSDQDGEYLGNVADPGISKWMIGVMWFVAIVLLIPIAFIVVYVEHCNNMRFEIS